MKTVPVFIINEDQRMMSRMAAQLFLEAAEKAISSRGKFTVALSGGSTPKEFFKQVSSATFHKKINWKKIFFFWSDERFLPHHSSSSNFNLASKYLLKKVPVPSSNIFPAPVIGLPGNAATLYEKTIKNFLGPKACFDWVMLGAGRDGHTASLFPGSKAILEKKEISDRRLVGYEYAMEDKLQFRADQQGQANNRIGDGKEKAAVVKAALSGKKAKKYPVQYIDAAKSIWLLDKEAAETI